MGSSSTLRFYAPHGYSPWCEDDRYVIVVGEFDPIHELRPSALFNWSELQTLPEFDVPLQWSVSQWPIAFIIGNADAAHENAPNQLAALRRAGWFLVWLTTSNPEGDLEAAKPATIFARQLAAAANSVVVAQTADGAEPHTDSSLLNAVKGILCPILYYSLISFDGNDVREYLSSPNGKPFRHYHLVCDDLLRNSRAPNADSIPAHSGRGFLSVLVPPHYAISDAANFIREIGNRLGPETDCLATLSVTSDDAPVEAHLYLA